MFNWIANISSNRMKATFVLLTWILVVAGAFLISPSLSDVSSGQPEEFLPVGAESVRAMQLGEEKYPSGDGIPAITVFYSEDGLNADKMNKIATFVQFLESSEGPELVHGVVSIFTMPELTPLLVSEDQKSMTVLATVKGVPSSKAFQDAVDIMAERARTIGGEVQVQTGVTGPASVLTDAVKVFQSINGQVTFATVVLVLVILFVIYRAPGLVFIPLFAVGTALILAQALSALVTDNFGLAINNQVTSIMSVLLFGAGTDYALFIISRYREELGSAENRFSAMTETMKRVAPSITGSASTTIVAMLILIFALSGSFKTMGPMLALAIAVVLLAGLTVLPATLVIFGKWIFWPLSVEANISRAQKKTIWHSIGHFVTERPRLVFVGTTFALMVAIIPIFYMIPSFNFMDGFPEDVESRIGYELLKKGFPEGELAPAYIYITTEQGEIRAWQSTIDTVAQTVENHPQVSRVNGASPPPPYIDMGAAYASRYDSFDGTTIRLDAILDGDPYSEKSLETIGELRETIDKLLIESGDLGIEVLLGGESAIVFDDKAALDRDTRVLAPIILGAILIVLIFLQRALIAPLYMLFSIIISYAATYGLSIWFFQSVLGHSGVAYANGIWIFVFLVALGADYNIFVMSRIREEIEVRGFKDGIASAVGKTGGVVTSAGIILAGTFFVLTTLPLRDIMQLGFAIMLGVLIDTFVVRPFLMPSMVAICGKLSWWPSKELTSR